MVRRCRIVSELSSHLISTNHSFCRYLPAGSFRSFITSSPLSQLASHQMAGVKTSWSAQGTAPGVDAMGVPRESTSGTQSEGNKAEDDQKQHQNTPLEPKSSPQAKESEQGDIKEMLTGLSKQVETVTEQLKAQGKLLETQGKGISNLSKQVKKQGKDLKDVKKQGKALSHQISGLRRDVARTTPAIVSAKLGGLVPSLKPSRDIIKGADATYTCIKHRGRIFVIGAAHCAYWYGKDRKADRVFVKLPRNVVSAGVKAVYRHRNLKHEGLFEHDFVAIEVTKVPADVEGPFPGWPLELSQWTKAGVMKGSVVGVSTSGTVSGTHLTSLSEYDRVGVFLEINGEPGHSGTLLYSSSTVKPKPIGVYFGVKGSRSKNFLPKQNFDSESFVLENG